jgi:hypothetical protein
MWKLWPHLPDTDVQVSTAYIMEAGQKSRLTQAAVISRISTGRTRSVKMHLADTADIILVNIPSPGGHSVPLLDGHLHRVQSLRVSVTQVAGERRNEAELPHP